MKLTFKIKPFLLFLVLLFIEIIIALYIKDRFIRPFVGDVLAVIGVYYFIESFFNFNKNKIIFWTCIFATILEFLQYFDIVKLLGLENNTFISIVVVRSFSFWDILCYWIGGLILMIFRKSYLKII